MRMEKIDRKKTIIVLLALIGCLAVVGRSELGESDVSFSEGASLLRIRSGEPPEFFEDFDLVPGSATLIEDRYILVLYERAEEQLYALAVFAATCEREGCSLGDLIAFSILDAQGQNLQQASTRGIDEHKTPHEHRILSRDFFTL